MIIQGINIPYTTLNYPNPLSQQETQAKGNSALDIINSIGQFVLSGIALARVPKQQLSTPVPQTPTPTVTQENTVGTFIKDNLILVGAAIILIIYLILK